MKRNRQDIHFTLKSFVGEQKEIQIKYGTTLSELDDIVKNVYNVDNGVKLYVGNMQINRQENQEKTIGDLMAADTQHKYTILVVFQPYPPPPPKKD